MARRSSSGLLLGLAAATAAGLALFAVTRSAKAAAPAQPGDDPSQPPAPPSSDDSDGSPAPPKDLVDPLPEFPLSQQSIIEALIDALKTGQTLKLRSVMAKSKTASFALRAYLLAALEAVPAQMKEDAQFVRDFAQGEAERIERMNNDPSLKSLGQFTSLTKALQVGIASLLPYFGKTTLAASDLLWGAISDHYYDQNLDASKARKGEDQIIPGYEGTGIRRGVRFTPDLPYIMPAERALADQVRNRWYRESESNEIFQSLPPVPAKTAFFHAPTYQNLLDAISKLREDGVTQ